MNTTSFQQMNLSSELLRAVENLGYREATAIQAEAIPLILQGRDVVGRSNTGTGKTAAFGIPAVERVVETARSRPQVLILCPTRELAMQIAEELKKLAQYKSGVRIATLYGGQSIEVQLRQLRTANLVVGTPGRVMDHMERRSLRLEEVGMVVLDEADEMLNMGFLEDIRSILSQVPEQRQTILFSATMPPAILSISRPVSAGSPGGGGQRGEQDAGRHLPVLLPGPLRRQDGCAQPAAPIPRSPPLHCVLQHQKDGGRADRVPQPQRFQGGGAPRGHAAGGAHPGDERL